MRRLVYYVGTTLDGYVAGPGGEFDFFGQGEGADLAEYQAWTASHYPETVPTAFRGLLGIDAPNQRFDTVVMGLATYRVGLPATPSPYSHLAQHVVSRTLPEAPHPEVRLSRDPVALVRALKAEPGLDVWLCGGGTLAGALTGEIDELVLKTYPVLAGAGIPVVAGGFSPTAFRVLEREQFANGVVVSRLERA
ncbi:dihydrofolate reductase family protein [Kineococcus rhizosphaerae]|uniref:Dihydrofolate reductase n=1 Tax=Kineococcus rhizosphaerae TaxID=559628 RepID=A0A2T0R041_9ACTN|nr:dihydrofolate reductase family protein [Kineococcus rhizosphaerae]PRY12480.1 dihydrofolate reductase [Kineococcus rhizosphaerae]